MHSLLNIAAGWCLIVLGALLGMTFGLWAESRQWAGGYGSFRRQCLRLAHIAAFALGMLNLLYALFCEGLADLPPWVIHVGSKAMAAGGILMPLVCFATAWRPRLKYLFPIPATCILIAVSVQAWGWLRIALDWR